MAVRPFALKPMHMAVQWSIAWMGSIPIVSISTIHLTLYLTRLDKRLMPDRIFILSLLTIVRIELGRRPVVQD